MASSLLDLANPNGDENTPSTTPPVDDALDLTGSGMGLPSATPGGGGLGSILGNALAVGLAGFAPTSSGFQNLVQQQVFKNMQQQRALDLAMAGNKTILEAEDLAAKGMLPEARAKLASNPAVLLSPAGIALHGKYAEVQRANVLQEGAARVYDQIDPLAGALMRSGLGKDQDALALAKFVREGGEWTPVEVPGTGQTKYVSKYKKNPDGSPVTFGIEKGLIKLEPGVPLGQASTDETGKTTVTPTYVVPPSQFAKDAPLGVRDQLDGPAYDKLRQREQSGIPEAGQLADTMYRQAQARHLASLNPEDVKVALQQTGVDPVRYQRGELTAPEADALAERVDARKNAQIVLNATITAKARLSVTPDERIFVKGDGSGQLVSGLDKVTAAQMVKDGQLFPTTAQSQQQLELAQTVVKPTIRSLQQLGLRLFPLSQEQPGLTVVQAIDLAVQRNLMSGEEARVYKGQVTELGTALSRIATGTVRPGQQTQESFKNEVIPNGGESLASFGAKLRGAEKLTDNRIDGMSGRAPRHTSTNPFTDPDIQRIQQGERPNGVNPDTGVFTFPAPIIAPGGVRIRGR